jgi:DNA polymerase-3 subunit delta'
MESLLPWQEPQWRALMARREQGRLPHALLLCGARGLGKLRFARLFGQALLCSRPGARGEPCHGCAACSMVRAGTHPGLCEVVPEAQGKTIRIDQIRALSAFMSLTASGYKVGIIAPAQEMSLAAANSLLKTLEEPPSGALLLLVAEQPSRLPATIRSRCQRIWFPPCDGSAAQAWLAPQVAQGETRLLLRLAGGAPLAAVELATGGSLELRRRLLGSFEELLKGRIDPCGASQIWTEAGLESALRWMGAWLRDMIRLKWVEDPPWMESPDLADRLRELARTVPLEQLQAGLASCGRALEGVLSRTNLNGQLLAEGILAEWAAPDWANSEEG